MPEDPDLSHRIPERREELNDVRGHESRRDTYQRYRGPPQVRIRQRLAVVPFTNTLGRLRQMDAPAMQVVRAEGRVARREVDLHLLGVAAAAWGCSSLWCSRRPRAAGAVSAPQSSGAVRHVWKAPKRSTRCTRIVRIYEQVWALIAIAGGAVRPQKPAERDYIIDASDL